MAASVAYVARAQASAFPPVVWAVDRPGHVNLNSAERLAALTAVIQKSEGQALVARPIALILATPSSVAAISAGKAESKITRTRPIYGNLYTDFVREDLTALTINLGDTFGLTHKTGTVRVTFAKTYSDVPLGAWVAFIDPEGHVQISRNYANAAETLNAVKGDKIALSKN